MTYLTWHYLSIRIRTKNPEDTPTPLNPILHTTLDTTPDPLGLTWWVGRPMVKTGVEGELPDAQAGAYRGAVAGLVRKG